MEETTQTGHILAGRYRVIAPIATGATAAVWEGFDQALQRPVAVKILRPQWAHNEALLARFQRESVAAARLNHRNIVKTYDAGIEALAREDMKLPFIVMELISGTDLRSALIKERFDYATIVRIGSQIAEALEYAHESGFVHGDVKPKNILLQKQDSAYIRALLTDFGSTSVIGDTSTNERISATAAYGAPEQLAGQAPTPLSDVYSLGLVLYEMVAERPPFSAETEPEVIALQRNTMPIPLNEIRGDLPPALNNVITKAIDKTPTQRYSSAGSLRTALLYAEKETGVIAEGERKTPPLGSKAVPKKQTQMPKKSRTPLVVWCITALAVVAAVAIFLQSGGFSLFPAQKNSKNSGQHAAIHIQSVQSFDPDGDGTENDGLLALIDDGNASTSWETQHYANRNFGNLKPGVGVIATFAQSPVSSISIDSPSSDWAVQIFTSTANPQNLGAWGTPVAQQQHLNGNVSLKFSTQNATELLVWITDLGTGQQVVLNEIVINQ